MPVLVDAESLAAVIARQQGNALQAGCRFPDEWNDSVASI
jgi:hypothetical protein